jgi:hypothetical protein
MTDGDRQQPTPIDREEYQQFIEFVAEQHDGTRGHLREELENALRFYREAQHWKDDLEDRVDRLERRADALRLDTPEGEGDA